MFPGSIVAQILWEQPITFWLDLKFIPQDRTYTWHDYWCQESVAEIGFQDWKEEADLSSYS